MNISLVALVTTLVASSFQTNLRHDDKDLFKLINDNISLFNQETIDADKQETHFNYLRNIINVKDKTERIEVGRILVFDDNLGFLFISNNNEVLMESYENGIPDPYSNYETLFFDGINLFDEQMSNITHKEVSLYGKNISEAFHSHYDSTFTSAKTRNLLSDWDPQYATLTDTSLATFRNKTTWSTYQSKSYNCGPLAIANLLWTYKINNVVDLTQGYTSSSSLSDALESYCNSTPAYGTSTSGMLGVNNFLTGGYHLDYINVTNGVADNLEISPVIGEYNYALDDGHFALITGKGKSLYKKVLWMDLYTSWDIVNTWSNRYDYDNSGYYLKCKYWVDNQRITFGYCLRDSNDNQVPLNNN